MCACVRGWEVGRGGEVGRYETTNDNRGNNQRDMQHHTKQKEECSQTPTVATATHDDALPVSASSSLCLAMLQHTLTPTTATEALKMGCKTQHVRNPVWQTSGSRLSDALPRWPTKHLYLQRISPHRKCAAIACLAQSALCYALACGCPEARTAHRWEIRSDMGAEWSELGELWYHRRRGNRG